MLQETRFQDQMLKSLSLSKKQAEKCKFIKARQLHLSSLRKLFQLSVLDSFYMSRFKETKILFCFLEFRGCVFGLSFLLTLDI